MPETERASSLSAVAAGLHALAPEAVLDALRVSPGGLDPAELARRRAEFGPNALPAAPPPSPFAVVLRQFKSPLIYILLVAAGAALALGDLGDALFIALVLVLNATIGAVQELRAERSAHQLRSLVSPHAVVIRGGVEQDVEASELVVGDIVVVESGTKIAADLRIIDGSIEVDESLLTGESVAVSKRARAELQPDTPLAERVTMAYAGTFVQRGRARGVVATTGLATQLGQIASSLSRADSAQPPLVTRMEQFSRRIALAVAVAVAALGGLMLLRGEDLHTVFLASVGLAVSVIPEGLPVALTVALAIAVQRMSRRKVIARRLAAVEALGSCTFIASDKTGTLTLNELTVQRVLVPGAPAWEVTGVGSAREGEIAIPPGQGGEGHALMERFARAVALCNDGTIAAGPEGWVGHGDAVDVALLILAAKAGRTREAAEQAAPRVAALPFESERQYAATAHEIDGETRIMLKGAGERVLRMCSRMATPGGEVALERGEIEAAADELAARGYKILAVADGPVSLDAEGAIDPETIGDLCLLGFVGMLDPLRPEVPAAIDACRRAGIEVAMVTGDHPVTALAIGRELGLAEAGEFRGVITGAMLREAAEAGEAHFDALVDGGRIFARVEPQQKLEVVQALLRAGHFVAVTGDGANDAPAMRAANLGVAMGRRGTDVAKETGELIVTDDNFASIVAGVEEGRIAYGNVRKVVFLLVSCGAAELALVTLAILTGLPIPLLPAQILWLNLVTNGIQDVALAFEPGEGGELERAPRAPTEAIFDAIMLRRTALTALVMGGVSFGAYAWMLDQGYELASARNLLLWLMVLFENVQAGNARSERRSLLALSPLRNRPLLIGVIVAHFLHVAATYTPGLRDVLRAEPISLQSWLLLAAMAVSLFVAMELEKLIFGRRGGAAKPAITPR